MRSGPRPNQDPKLFAPPQVDCDQWAQAAVAASGLALSVSNAGTADGANIELRTYKSAPNQQWQIVAS